MRNVYYHAQILAQCRMSKQHTHVLALATSAFFWLAQRSTCKKASWKVLFLLSRFLFSRMVSLNVGQSQISEPQADIELPADTQFEHAGHVDLGAEHLFETRESGGAAGGRVGDFDSCLIWSSSKLINGPSTPLEFRVSTGLCCQQSLSLHCSSDLYMETMLQWTQN